MKFHYVRDMVNEKQVKFEYISTDENLADLMTKPLPKEKFIQFRTAIGMVNDIPNWGGVLEQRASTLNQGVRIFLSLIIQLIS